MQDNVTVSPLDAWSSAGVLTEMEETREGAGGGMSEKGEDTYDVRVTQWTNMITLKENIL